MRLARVALFSAMLSAGAMPLAGAAVPLDAGGFSAFMADRFAAADPTAKIEVVGPFTLDMKRSVGGHTVYLVNIHNLCERAPEQCREAADAFVRDTLAMQTEFGGPIERANIRVIVRGSPYVRQLERAAASDPQRMGIFRPIVGDLWEICVVDAPHGVATLQRGQAAKLGLSEEQAFALGRRNVAASLPSLAAETHQFGDTGATYASGNFYETSRLLLHDQWEAQSKADGGDLVVAIPSVDVVVFGRGTDKVDRATLGLFARFVFERTGKPVSTALLRWTPAGWELVPP